MKTLHLLTQRDQPYGSERRCCEECGLMLVARPVDFWQSHTYVTDEPDYHNNHTGHTICRAAAPTSKE